MNTVVALDPRLAPGHNLPPEPTPFEQVRDEIDGLYLEAKNWADGAPVDTQEQADAIAKLRDLLRAAAKRADEYRVLENKPFDDGKAEVQARYADLIADTKSKKGKTVLAMEALNRALQPYLLKLEEAKRAEAKRLRDEADAAAAKAAAELQAARKASDLEAMEKAEQAVATANKIEMAASRAEDSKAHAKGAGRAVGLRTTYRPEITDMREFARFVWGSHFDYLADHLTIIAGKLVADGIRTMPGVTVHEDRSL